MAGIAIVAIPEQDDPVWKVSSEKVPHLTLLYLEGPLTNEENTIRFIQHAVKTSLHRFGLSVDRRGILGADNADVVFLDKRYGGKELLSFRGYLLTNTDILNAYRKAEQYPVWTPHVTLGFPDTPANKVDEKLYWINFDRIAVWTGDYVGPEFLLEEDRGKELDIPGEWSDDFSDFLEHFGVRGMKWGVRRATDSSGRVTGSKKASATRRRGKKNTPGKAVAKYGATAHRNSLKKLNSDPRFKGKNLNKDSKLKAQYHTLVKSSMARDLKTAAKIAIPLALVATSVALAPSFTAIGAISLIHVGRATYSSVKDAFGTSTTTFDSSSVGEIQKAGDGWFTVEYDGSKILAKGDPQTTDISDVVMDQQKSGSTFDLENLAQSALAHAKVSEKFSIYYKVDSNGLFQDVAFIPEEDEVAQSQFDSPDDVLVHFGVRGMKWGVRRSVGPDGLVIGKPPGLAKKSGGKSDDDPPDSVVKIKRGRGSADHQRMVKNLDKKIENLSTADIKALTARLKAINELKATTAAEKAAKASLGKKLTRWALSQVAEGVNQQGGKYVKELVGETLLDVLPKTKTQVKRDTKERQAQEDRDARIRKEEQAEADRADRMAREAERKASATGQGATSATKYRDEAVNELVYEITKMPKKKGG